jgi:predicted nucleic-acid-binding protein
MIGLDTNVLTRYLVQDDPIQTLKARAIFASLTPEEPGWVPLIGVLELVWVLTSRFRATRAEVCKVLDQLLGARQIIVESIGTLKHALELYRRGNADFADCLISSAARAEGCSKTLTFDKDAAKTAGMTLIP